MRGGRGKQANLKRWTTGFNGISIGHLGYCPEEQLQRRNGV
jgi:hypothetical protein